MRSPVRLFIALAILLATATVAAQVYKWVDKDGRVQYTDIPPPASATKVEAKKVDTSPATASTSAPAVPAKSAQMRAKEAEKLKTEAAEKTRKRETDQKNAEISAANCQASRTVLRDLETGRPSMRTNEAGAREFLSDEARQDEMTKARKSIAEFCKD